MEEGNKRRLRLLHTADVHMETLRDKGCRSLEALVNVAIRTKVDLVIIAGDFFDHNWVDDSVISFAVNQLQRVSVPIIILPGNHDHLSPTCIYQRAEFWKDARHVTIIRDRQGETHNFPDLGLSIWGKPLTDMDDERLLEPIPQVQNGWRRVAIAHGYYVESQPPLFPNYQITPEEVAASRQDYIALGHVPVFRCAAEHPVKAYYSGEPQVCGTVNIVTLREEGETHVARYSIFKKEYDVRDVSGLIS